MRELLNKRTEKSKLFKDGNQYHLTHCLGPIHYKDNYNVGDWQDINTDYYENHVDYKLYNKLPLNIKVFKNKIGYEIESKRSGDKYTVELDTTTPNIKDVEFEFEILPTMIRLWKTAKTDKVKNLKWKIIKTAGGKNKYNLKFRDKPQAYDLTTKDSKTKTGYEEVNIETKRTDIDSNSYYWEETLIKDVKIDTDVVEYSTDDGYEDGETPHVVTTGPYGVAVGINDYYWGAFRFTSVAVAQGAVISSSTIDVCNSGYAEGATACNIYGEDEDDSSVLVSGEGTDITDRTQTTEYGTITLSSGVEWGDQETSSSLNAVIQEIVDRPGWSSGNDLCLLFYPNGTNEWDIIGASSGEGSEYLPTLNITYSTSWSGKINGVTNIAKVNGIPVANIKSVNGVE